MKVHWLFRRWSDFPLSVACGSWKLDADSPNTTENPDDVTCLNCQRHIEDDMKTIDDEAEERGRRKAKQRGRGRAVSELVGLGERTEHCIVEICSGCDDPQCVALDVHPCPSCSGSGLVPTEKLRGDVAVTLRGMIDDRSPAQTFTEVAGAVLRKVAEHIGEGR